MTKCNFCGKGIDIAKPSTFNYLCGSYSHKSCDDKYFEKQEKKVRYTKSSNLID